MLGPAQTHLSRACGVLVQGGRVGAVNDNGGCGPGVIGLQIALPNLGACMGANIIVSQQWCSDMTCVEPRHMHAEVCLWA